MPRAQGLVWVPCRCGCGHPAIIFDRARGPLPALRRGHHRKVECSTVPADAKRNADTERFWASIDLSDPLNCWEWKRRRNRGGYGLFNLDGKRVSAHRYSYEQAIGPIPEGLDIDHLCRNRACVRPDHLEPVTRRENLDRGIKPKSGLTHCKRGHEFTPENTARNAAGHRTCIICRRAAIRRAYYRAKERAQAQ